MSLLSILETEKMFRFDVRSGGGGGEASHVNSSDTTNTKWFIDLSIAANGGMPGSRGGKGPEILSVLAHTGE